MEPRNQDAQTKDGAQAILAEIDEVRSKFHQLLRAADSKLLVERPASGEWSAIENVRHLLFAEQLHLGPFLPGDRSWSKIGLPPHFLATKADFSEIGREPTDDIEAVLTAWGSVHARAQSMVAEATPEMLLGGTVDGAKRRPLGQVLEGVARHDLHHIRLVEALLDGSTT